MKVGKISEVALKRAVLKQLNSKREEVLFGGGIGEDCAAMKLEKEEVCVVSSNPVTGAGKIQGALAIYSAVNNLVTSGAEPVGCGRNPRFLAGKLHRGGSVQHGAVSQCAARHHGAGQRQRDGIFVHPCRRV